jgi:hypothetical protein
MGRMNPIFQRVWQTIEPPGSSYFISRWLFLRLMGAIYGIAFVSLWLQIDGLIGHNGILPAADYLQAVRQQVGAGRYWYLPTLCWLSASDGFLHGLCASGAVLSVLVVAGVAPGLCLAMLWVLYLSLSTVCREFLGFQWDVLLLETGFLAIFLAPRQWLPALAREPAPSLAIVWLLRWLLFRLMLMSGAVKLLSADTTWWQLTALHVHYETQPLPTWLGWHAHHLPGWIQQLCVFLMFIIELVAPAFILAGRRLRLAAAVTFTGFMAIIAATGNYCFFNLLTVALCLLLVDDATWRRGLPQKFFPERKNPILPRWELACRFGAGLLAGVILLVSGTQTAVRLLAWNSPPALLLKLVNLVSPLRTVNSYGLFAVMTTKRPEIVVEGSDDGVRWQAYEFKWKPGDLKRAPGFVAPHQPRLDWQMWFAALGNVQGNPWFVNFLVRLLQGSPEVLALLERNPFPQKPPRYIRAVLYEYHCTDASTRAETSQWWRREEKGLYCQPLTLQQQR